MLLWTAAHGMNHMSTVPSTPTALRRCGAHPAAGAVAPCRLLPSEVPALHSGVRIAAPRAVAGRRFAWTGRCSALSSARTWRHTSACSQTRWPWQLGQSLVPPQRRTPRTDTTRRFGGNGTSGTSGTMRQTDVTCRLRHGLAVGAAGAAAEAAGFGRHGQRLLVHGPCSHPPQRPQTWQPGERQLKLAQWPHPANPGRAVATTATRRSHEPWHEHSTTQHCHAVGWGGLVMHCRTGRSHLMTPAATVRCWRAASAFCGSAVTLSRRIPPQLPPRLEG